MHPVLQVLVLALDQLQLGPQLCDRLAQRLQLRGRAEGLESSLGQEVVLDGQLALQVRHERVVEAENEEAGVRIPFESGVIRTFNLATTSDILRNPLDCGI